MAKNVLIPWVHSRSRQLLEQLVENVLPSEGIFYIVRNPEGWEPLCYRFDEFPEFDHSDFWEEFVVPVVSMRWAKVLGLKASKLEKELELLPYAFPRGRISRNSVTQYVVYHGGNLPSQISKKTINRMFGLPSNANWEFDSHEVCSLADKAAISRIFKLNRDL